MGGGGSVDCVSPPTDPGWIEVVEKLLLLLLCHIPGGGGGYTHRSLNYPISAPILLGEEETFW